ncbi:LacI family DNA-binding transcriptional regulator [Acidipropionibacterium virtanenii]|uniref:HTH-type transcriptional regulator GalR n=1 Tax=Acidipropionibacterium virtanenii TaxID=2057246 RepID=A0A344UW81_9ACTN|nr:LacI family DNA-binding transcriptional regulator [Acidipropionibacterium virtanenii]AXE39529.1 HTH-type transcriptional regulator GalR [Acidipropionibacterium virtanenii]
MGNATARPPKKVTIRDVARLAGTSTSTVSVALSGGAHVSKATRRRVIDAADRLGWRPDRRAAGLRRFHSRQVGIIYEVAQSFQASLLDALYVAMAEEGLDAVLAGATVHHTEQTCVAELLRDGCQAMVLTGSGLSDHEIAAIAARIPTLSLCRQLSLGGVDVVACDSRQGAATAVEALVGLGHREIMHVNGGGRPMTTEREQGYVGAMTRLGLAGHIRIMPGGSTVEAGVAAAQAIAVLRPRPTAVTCFNDMCAGGLLRQLRLQGIGVPREISVVGFDDAPVASDPTTALTSVRQDAVELAARAAALLRTRVELEGPVRPGAEQVITIGTELVTRTTTSPPGAGPAG